MLLAFAFALETLRVGAGQPFARIEEAVAAAKPGDHIEILAGEYSKTAVRITTPRLTIQAIGKVILDGKGSDYSGTGRVPRAIVQIDADGVSITGFELTGAHNKSHNGAGIRINAGRRTSVTDCDIHGNDMGIMSNGITNDSTAGADQLIERCHIHHNGDPGEPGQNHNLYLGGTSATLRFCEIDHSITGHNLKSRAHLTRVEYCWIHDAANREMDFVDAWDTERPGSDAVVIGSTISKDPNCPGNHGVIHFGREKGRRVGMVKLINDTIETPFSTPVVMLDGGEVAADLLNCIVKGKTIAEGGPSTVRTDSTFPAYRWAGQGTWIKSTDPFKGAG